MTALCNPDVSSLSPNSTRWASESPEYTASVVSKSLPTVVIVTSPLVSELHDHQTVLPPATYGLMGSPVSVVAPLLEPMVYVAEVEVGQRLEK